MKRWLAVFTVALSMIILLSPFALQAANPTAPTAKKADTSSTKVKPSNSAKAGSTAVQPQAGGIYKVIIRSGSNLFGYPPRIAGSGRDYAPPFFDHLINIGDDGKYHPGLALSWDTSKDGKAITFKLREGVTFHDGTPFNAQAVKANIDNLIPPNEQILSGITSVDVIDDRTVKLNFSEYNNLILFHLANNPATYMYSPEALKKNGKDWAMTHPVGTGPFMLKDYQPNISLTAVKNLNYWQKGLPYLDGIEMLMIGEAITQALTLKAGQAHAIYSAQQVVAELRDQGYPLQAGNGGFLGLCFDTRNSEIFSKLKVREAIEYAIDKELICSGPGQGLYAPMYQIVPSTSPDYNPTCPPRKYNPAKAKQLLAEAGYPNGFSFKMFYLDSAWKDGIVAVQNYLAQVGIKMEVNYVNNAGYNLIRAGGKIEKGAASFMSYPTSSNTLYTLDNFWRSDATNFQFVVKPAGTVKLTDQAKLSRDAATVTKINRQIIKLLYDDETVVPFWQAPRMAIVDKSVQNTGWFIYGDPDNNQFGTRTWLKK
jgi:peptide/nickel transport system substrate-binding protein